MRQKGVVHTMAQIRKANNQPKDVSLYTYKQIEFMFFSKMKFHCMEYQLHGMTLNYICLKSSTINSYLSKEEYQIL